MNDINNIVDSQSTDSAVGIKHCDTNIEDTEGSNSTIGLTCTGADDYNDSFSDDAIQACIYPSRGYCKINQRHQSISIIS